MPTHLGQDIADHVTLVNELHKGGSRCNSGSWGKQALFRVLADGSLDDKPFKVPKGRVLVVTDVEWAAWDGALETNRTLVLMIHVGKQPDFRDNPGVFMSSVTVSPAEEDSLPGSGEYTTSGFLVPAGAQICPHVFQEGGTGSPVTATIRILILRGYLTDS